MKQLYFLSLVLLLSSMGAVFAQQTETVRNVFEQITVSGAHEGVPYYAVNADNGNKVKGSEYLQEDFTEGFLMSKDMKIYRVKGRYDAFNDEVQVVSDKQQIQAIFPERVKAVSLGGQIFVPHLIEGNKGNLSWGFFELLSEGKVHLLKRYYATSQAVKDHPVLGSVGNDFEVTINKKIYVAFPKQTAKKLKKGKKHILKLLADEKGAIMRFVKKNKLTYKKTEDLTRIFNYYNKLRAEEKS